MIGDINAFKNFRVFPPPCASKDHVNSLFWQVDAVSSTPYLFSLLLRNFPEHPRRYWRYHNPNSSEACSSSPRHKHELATFWEVDCWVFNPAEFRSLSGMVKQPKFRLRCSGVCIHSYQSVSLSAWRITMKPNRSSYRSTMQCCAITYQLNVICGQDALATLKQSVVTNADVLQLQSRRLNATKCEPTSAGFSRLEEKLVSSVGVYLYCSRSFGEWLYVFEGYRVLNVCVLGVCWLTDWLVHTIIKSNTHWHARDEWSSAADYNRSVAGARRMKKWRCPRAAPSAMLLTIF